MAYPWEFELGYIRTRNNSVNTESLENKEASNFRCLTFAY